MSNKFYIFIVSKLEVMKYTLMVIVGLFILRVGYTALQDGSYFLWGITFLLSLLFVYIPRIMKGVKS